MNLLAEELKRYGESDFYPFHMPGHKRKEMGSPVSRVYPLDITEIDGFDNLHHAEGILKEAQERAGKLYHSEKTYFLVNGSTCGLLTAISAVAGRGSRILVARNCHKAVYHGIMLNHLQPEYLFPELIEAYGISGGISAKQVERSLQELVQRENILEKEISSMVCAVLVTSPSYDGILSDVRGICEAAHHYGIPVIVDQAHGAHFGFHRRLPESAVTEGADLVIHSVHKMLPAPTQTALLHVNGKLVDPELVQKYLAVYETSSPSYLLMAGIDSCMAYLEKEGEAPFERILKYRQRFTERCRDLKHIRIYPADVTERSVEGEEAGLVMDEAVCRRQEPFRFLISVRGSSCSGSFLMEQLRRSYHLELEMAAYDYVIALLSVMDDEEGFERLADALREIDLEIERQMQETGKNPAKQKPASISIFYQQYKPKQSCRMEEAFRAETEEVLLIDSDRRTAADFVMLYPPGIPVLVPGEEIDKTLIRMIREYLEQGFDLQGITHQNDMENDGNHYKIRCVKEESRRS